MALVARSVMERPTLICPAAAPVSLVGLQGTDPTPAPWHLLGTVSTGLRTMRASGCRQTSGCPERASPCGDQGAVDRVGSWVRGGGAHTTFPAPPPTLW